MEVADYLGLPHAAYTPRREDLLAARDCWAKVMDQPNGDPASVMQFAGLAFLPPDISAILDGMGNSWYFGGSKPAHLRRYNRRRLLPNAVIPWGLLLDAAADRSPGGYSFLRRWSTAPDDSFVIWDGWHWHELAELWGRRVDFRESEIQRVTRTVHNGDVSLTIAALFDEIISGQSYIQRTVAAVAASGRAVRFPYADNRLAQFVVKLFRASLGFL